MASLDSLPPDQRAVLQLVLQRGRSYDDIAQLLSIDRAAVRDRALSAFDALGPQTRVDAGHRALITDYLLGQLPVRVAADTRDRLAGSASERAWARVLAAELAPLSAEPLPEIPADGGRPAAPAPAAAPAQPEAAEPAPPAAPDPVAAPAQPEAAEPDAGAAASEARTEPARQIPPAAGAPEPAEDSEGSGPPISRRGGAILLAVVVVVIVVVIVLIASGGSNNKTPVASTPTTPTTPATTPSGTTSTPSTSTTPATTPATTPGTTPTTPTKPLAQINLTSPTSVKGTGGFADVVKQGTQLGIVIAAQGIAANTKHNAYAVWLANPGGTSLLLGFVSPPVSSNGRLETVGKLPANAASFKDVLVTLETVAKPKGPGTIVLQGTLKLH
jgi:hypothetical protein